MSAPHPEVSGPTDSARLFWSRRRGKMLVLAIVVMAAIAALRLPSAFGILARAGFYGDVPKIFHDLVPRWFAGLPVYAYSYLAVHPPATYALMWPVFGPLDADTARAVWIALSIAAIGALVLISVRESLADSADERLFAALMPVCMYAMFFTVRSGQLGVLLLPLLVGALTILKRHAPSWKRDAAAAMLLLIALVKPTVAAPFIWIALFLPGGLRPVLLASFGYAALTMIALGFQPQDPATLFREWQGRTEDLAATGGSANLHRSMTRFALESWLLPVSLILLASLGWWTHRNRKADLWLLIGVAAIFARFWTYHRQYDDVLLLLPAIALFRLTKHAQAGDGADVKSGVLLALIVATWLLPINLLTTRRFHFLVVAPIMLLWIATAIFLAWQARARERLRNSTGVPEFRAAV
ncbi:MAG TPA: glycosyltransferase 87 family protein [Candidatus Binatia bacterium]|nr:glycosyltransferase 87 family protein [Candidatus Binatia bacterium]